MSTTITIRTSEELREALEKQAKARNKTASELAREILARGLCERPISERAGHLRGILGFDPEASDPWRREIELRNRRD